MRFYNRHEDVVVGFGTLIINFREVSREEKKRIENSRRMRLTRFAYVARVGPSNF